MILRSTWWDHHDVGWVPDPPESLAKEQHDSIITPSHSTVHFHFAHATPCLPLNTLPFLTPPYAGGVTDISPGSYGGTSGDAGLPGVDDHTTTNPSGVADTCMVISATYPTPPGRSPSPLGSMCLCGALSFPSWLCGSFASRLPLRVIGL